jgi:Flp pilus assembly pilin Flp
MLTPLQSFIADETAATTVEYAVLVAFIAFVAITSVGTFGLRVKALFEPPASFIAGGPLGH